MKLKSSKFRKAKIKPRKTKKKTKKNKKYNDKTSILRWLKRRKKH